MVNPGLDLAGFKAMGAAMMGVLQMRFEIGSRDRRRSWRYSTTDPN